MFIEFTVGNYRSFFEPMTLSLEATKLRSDEKNLDEQNVFQTGNLSLSAKEAQAGEPTGVERFRLNTAARQEPASFQIIFGLDNVRYRYGFEVEVLPGKFS